MARRDGSLYGDDCARREVFELFDELNVDAEDRDLLMAVRVWDVPVAELAKQMGLHERAVYRRRVRAEERIAEAVAVAEAA